MEGVSVYIGWNPADIGIPNNEDAGKDTKAMAASVTKGLVEVDNKIAILVAMKIAKRISKLFGKQDGTELFMEISLDNSSQK